MNQISEKQLNDAEKQFKTFESMINSMTPQERSNPDLLARVSSSPPASEPTGRRARAPRNCIGDYRSFNVGSQGRCKAALLHDRTQRSAMLSCKGHTCRQRPDGGA